MKVDYFADYLFTLNKKDDAYTMIVECPQYMTYDYFYDKPVLSFGFVPSATVTEAEAGGRLYRSCERVSINFKTQASAELNSEFPPASVMANFTRKLKGQAIPTYSPEKINPEVTRFFTFVDNSKEYQLILSIFPYRNGSKVEYKIPLTTTCKPNAGCDSDPDFVRRLAATLGKIAND